MLLLRSTTQSSTSNRRQSPSRRFPGPPDSFPAELSLPAYTTQPRIRATMLGTLHSQLFCQKKNTDSTDAQLRRWQDEVLEPVKVQPVCVLSALRTAFEDCFSWHRKPFSSCSHAHFVPLVQQPRSVPLNLHGRSQRDTDPGWVKPAFCMNRGTVHHVVDASHTWHLDCFLCASNVGDISLQVCWDVYHLCFNRSLNFLNGGNLSLVCEGNVHRCVTEVSPWTSNCFLHFLSSLALPRNKECWSLHLLLMGAVSRALEGHSSRPGRFVPEPAGRERRMSWIASKKWFMNL